MTDATSACPRCGRATEPSFSYCPQCAMVLDPGDFDREALSDRIRYIRRESESRDRRNAVIHSLANIAVGFAVLILVGGGIILFHPALVPSLFKPGQPIVSPEMPGVPHPDDTTESEAPILPFDWVTVPSGPYWYGPSRGRIGEDVVQLQVDAFAIMKYEVTNGQWAKYLIEERESLEAEGKFESAVPENWDWKPDSGQTPWPPSEEMLEEPVVYITWYEAQEFCTRWLARRPGCGGARLPTKKEWEKAARGMEDARAWPWGNEFYGTASDGTRMLRCNVVETGISAAVSVRSFFLKTDVSPFGVVGMAGNVAEFVGDRYSPGIKGGTFLTRYDDAMIEIDWDLKTGDELAWSYVGFRAARSLTEGE